MCGETNNIGNDVSPYIKTFILITITTPVRGRP